MHVSLRPAGLDDVQFYADVLSAVDPERPTDPVLLRHWWEHPPSSWVMRRWVADLAGSPVGCGEVAHPRWDAASEPWAELNGDIVPEHRSEAALDALFAVLEEHAGADGAAIVRLRANETDDLRIGAILARGYREDRRGRRWLLDLVAGRERILEMTRESRERMRSEGVEILTLDRDTDPDRYLKLWRMSEEAARDVPSTFGHVDETLDDFLSWLRSPGNREDRFWIARIGPEIVGCSVLSYPPVRGIVTTDWTGTARSVRGRGVARALKCETVVQAMALGVARVRTGNDAANAPILHINEKMGYRPWVGAINFTRSI